MTVNQRGITPATDKLPDGCQLSSATTSHLETDTVNYGGWKSFFSMAQRYYCILSGSYMKIPYYMPFKPLGHINPSGDLITGMELYEFLAAQQHDIDLVSRLRSRWLYRRPWKLLNVALERKRIVKRFKSQKPDIWLSYHSYYKAPDLLGPYCSKKLGIPYTIFQGIYSTKRKRNPITYPGFLMNRQALLKADLVFTNKRNDELNLKRLLPQDRVQYIAPGLKPEQFVFDLVSRKALREKWATAGRRVVMTTAMFRPGVKTIGVKKVIDSCAELMASGYKILLVVIGDGINRSVLEQEGNKKLGNNILFVGKVPRAELYRYYSGADVFAFPGIQESLGMVYLEAQSSGLPAVAFHNWGAKEAIVHETTGFLSDASEPDQFVRDIARLLDNRQLRIDMREAAKNHIRQHHDSKRNFQEVNKSLERLRLAHTGAVTE